MPTMILIVFLIMTQICGALWVHNTQKLHDALTCPFSISNWDQVFIEAPPVSIQCSYMQYYPDNNLNFFRLDPVVLFAKFDGWTFHFWGDSVTLQHFINFSCRLLGFSVESHIQRVASKMWCNHKNHCINAIVPLPPLVSAEILFSYRNSTIKVVFPGQENTLERYHDGLMSSNNVIVTNFGKHYEDNPSLLKKLLPEYLTYLKTLQESGVTVFWRESTASKFNTSQGEGTYQFLSKNGLPRVCVDSQFLDHEKAWFYSTNQWVLPMVRELGIPILEVFDATFAAPGYCNINMGKDCVHFFQHSGVVNWYTDILLYELYKLT